MIGEFEYLFLHISWLIFFIPLIDLSCLLPTVHILLSGLLKSVYYMQSILWFMLPMVFLIRPLLFNFQKYFLFLFKSL